MDLLSDKRRLFGHGLRFQTSVYSSAFVCSFQNLPGAVDSTRFQGRSVPSKKMHLCIWACYLPFWQPLCTKAYSLATPHKWKWDHKDALEPVQHCPCLRLAVCTSILPARMDPVRFFRSVRPQTSFRDLEETTMDTQLEKFGHGICPRPPSTFSLNFQACFKG